MNNLHQKRRRQLRDLTSLLSDGHQDIVNAIVKANSVILENRNTSEKMAKFWLARASDLLAAQSDRCTRIRDEIDQIRK